MSKSLGNVVAPWDVIDRYGADAFRWYLFTSKQPWDNYRFSLETIGEAVRQFLLQLWNTYSFYVLYANANEMERDVALDLSDASDLDRWTFSRLQATTQTVIERLDEFDATTPAGRSPSSSTSSRTGTSAARRRRFWDGDPVAFGLLRECILTLAKLLAPFCPFLSDEIYDNLDGAQPSVHLCDFPTARRARSASSSRRWRPRARRCGSDSPLAPRRSSRSASRCAPRWSSRPARSETRSSGSPRSSARS